MLEEVSKKILNFTNKVQNFTLVHNIKKEISEIDKIPHLERDYGFQSGKVEKEIEDKNFTIQLIVEKKHIERAVYKLKINDKTFSLEELFELTEKSKINTILSDVLPKLLSERKKDLKENEFNEKLRQKQAKCKSDCIELINKLEDKSEGYTVKQDISYEKTGDPKNWDSDNGNKNIQTNIYDEDGDLVEGSKSLLHAYHTLYAINENLEKDKKQEHYSDFS